VSRNKIRKGLLEVNVCLPGRCYGGLVSIHVINMYVGGGQARLILNLGTRLGEWLAAFTECFTSDKQPMLPIDIGTRWAWDPVLHPSEARKMFIVTLEHQTALPQWTST
jgi:hypothetical protein